MRERKLSSINLIFTSQRHKILIKICVLPASPCVHKKLINYALTCLKRYPLKNMDRVINNKTLRSFQLCTSLNCSTLMPPAVL